MLSARPSPVLICTALVVAVFAGCGGKSSTTSSTTSAASLHTATGSNLGKSSTARQLIAMADAICRESKAQLVRSDKRFYGEKHRQQRAELAAHVVRNETIERRTTGELAKLTPPSDLAPAFGKIVEYKRSLANQLGDLAALVRRGATASFSTLRKSKDRLSKQLAEVASKAGFKDCAIAG
jgi:hypothetical protein